MISEWRMRTDVVGQLMLASISLLLFLLGAAPGMYVVLVILWLWQLGSALQLYYGYRRPLRGPFLGFAITQLIAALSLIWLLPEIILGLFVSSGLFYLWRSIRDWQIVARQPKSFWDL